MVKLFIYGSLLSEDIQLRVIGRIIKRTQTLTTDSQFGIVCILHGYTRTKDLKIDNEYYWRLNVGNDDDIVKGLVIELTDDEIKKVDEYETDAYKRFNTIVQLDRNIESIYENVQVYMPKDFNPINSIKNKK